MEVKSKIFIVIFALLSFYFIGQGVYMHSQVNELERELNSAQDNYFIQSKAVRDSAESGSNLNAYLVQIEQLPSELSKLKLIGLGKMIMGVYVLLFGILIALVMLPERMKDIVKKR